MSFLKNLGETLTQGVTGSRASIYSIFLNEGVLSYADEALEGILKLFPLTKKTVEDGEVKAAIVKCKAAALAFRDAKNSLKALFELNDSKQFK